MPLMASNHLIAVTYNGMNLGLDINNVPFEYEGDDIHSIGCDVPDFRR